ncbi:hypothetical protein FRUB_08122 [Fimbriiglobus ruber]|uniref:Uncharacterized protein n=1 Tax=Fimbriiglobus ruber TaxID=1908690 RepID=A0A225DEI1_9BACT|nr:hypothetical protein FRUB_08122 [Fimbriiglobus ruber]
MFFSRSTKVIWGKYQQLPTQFVKLFRGFNPDDVGFARWRDDIGPLGVSSSTSVDG